MVKTKRVKTKYTLFTGKQLLWLILPIVIEQIFSTSLGFIDSAMVSHIDNAGHAGNAVGNVDQINNLIIQLFSAFATGGAIITSQYLGANRHEEARTSAKHMLVVVSIMSVLIAGLCLALNNPLLKLFFGGVDGDVHSMSRTYFYITAASFPFIGLFNGCAALLRAQRKSIFTMISAGVSCLLNFGTNYIFIFKLHMGVLGAALATLICRAIPAVFMFCLLLNKRIPIHISFKEKFRFNWGMIKHILKIAIPSGIESALFQLGKLLTVTFVNTKNYVNAAGINVHANANTMAMYLNNIGSVVGGGVGTSCITVVGQAVGTGDLAQTKHYIKKMFLVSYVTNAICVAVIMASASPLLHALYNYPDEAFDIALKCLYLSLSFQFITYPLSFTTPGILKATSDVKYVMFSAIASMALMRVGLCCIFTQVVHLGAYGFWIGMCSDWVLRSILFISRLLSGRWKKSSGLFKEPVAEAVSAGGTGETADIETDGVSATVGECLGNGYGDGGLQNCGEEAAPYGAEEANGYSEVVAETAAEETEDNVK